MKKRVSVLAVIVAVAASCLCLEVETARAIPPFKKEFDTLYVKKDSTAAPDVAFVAAVEKVKCNVCHKGKDKKLRNAYGEELAKLLDKKADAKDAAKIKDALEKVAAMPSDPANASSPKFGDLIKEGKLPGGDEEPAAE